MSEGVRVTFLVWSEEREPPLWSGQTRVTPRNVFEKGAVYTEREWGNFGNRFTGEESPRMLLVSVLTWVRKKVERTKGNRPKKEERHCE